MKAINNTVLPQKRLRNYTQTEQALTLRDELKKIDQFKIRIPIIGSHIPSNQISSSFPKFLDESKRRLSNISTGDNSEKKLKLQKNKESALKSRKKKKLLFEQYQINNKLIQDEISNLKVEALRYTNLISKNSMDSLQLQFKIQNMQRENEVLQQQVEEMRIQNSQKLPLPTPFSLCSHFPFIQPTSSLPPDIRSTLFQYANHTFALPFFD